MGYTTQFKLTLPRDADSTTQTSVLEYLCSKDLLAEDDYFEFNPADGKRWVEVSNKWYDHVWDMLTLSAKHTSIEFRLEGEGRSQGDVWEEQYLGGKYKHIRPRIVWPSEDEITEMPWKSTP